MMFLKITNKGIRRAEPNWVDVTPTLRSDKPKRKGFTLFVSYLIGILKLKP